jgi:hypothetical protein
MSLLWAERFGGHSTAASADLQAHFATSVAASRRARAGLLARLRLVNRARGLAAPAAYATGDDPDARLWVDASIIASESTWSVGRHQAVPGNTS